MAWSLKNARKAWRGNVWRTKKAVATMARNRGESLSAWSKKDYSDRSSAFKLGTEASIHALKILKVVGKACVAMLRACDEACSMARGGLSLRGRIELLRLARGGELLWGEEALDKSIVRAGKRAAGRKDLGAILAATAQEGSLDLSLMRKLLDAGARLDRKWHGAGVLEKLHLHKDAGSAAFAELVERGAAPCHWSARELRKAAKERKENGFTNRCPSALRNAIRRRHWGAITALIALTDIVAEERQLGGILAHLCIELRHSSVDSETFGSIVDLLLRAGANINGRDLQGQTALSISLCNGLDSWAIALLERGAAADASIRHELRGEASFEFLEVSDLFLQIKRCGQRRACLDEFGPMHAGEDKKTFELATFLIKNGAKLSSKYTTTTKMSSATEDGGRVWMDCEESIIHAAASHPELIEMALLLGADNGLSRGHLLEQKTVVQYWNCQGLTDGPKKGSTALWLAVEHGRVASAEILVEKGASLHSDQHFRSGDAPGKEPCCLLARAVGKPEMVEWALKVMEHSQEQQDEAFWWACGKSLECMKMLSPSSIEIEIAGETCLDRALGSLMIDGRWEYGPTHGDRVGWLLDRGARAQTRGKRAVSLFSVAEHFHDASWAGFLLRAGQGPWGLDEEGFSTLDRACLNGLKELGSDSAALSGIKMGRALFQEMLKNPARARRYAKRTARRIQTGEMECENAEDMLEAMEGLVNIAADKTELMSFEQDASAAPARRRSGRL